MTGSVAVRARNWERYWQKTCKGFIPGTAHRVVRKSGLCNSPGEALRDVAGSAELQRKAVAGKNGI